jgi:putative sporulation protein YtxC
VLETLIEFFDEGNEFVLEGFIQFRLKKYKKTLKTVVAQMKKEYDTQKEYKEFLRLLKYFVDVQETSTEMVHIVGMDDGGFQLFDKNKDDITQQSIAEFEKDFEIQDVNEDDLLVSTLITIAPRNIIIHRKDMIQNKQLVETIANIFQGKIAFCTGCELCESGNENQST